MAEDAASREPTRKHTCELDRVDLDALSTDALAELPAGRSLKDELERLAVDGRPLADDVGDEATVVVGGRQHVAACRHADVDPVRPHVAREPDVEEVLELAARQPATT